MPAMAAHYYFGQAVLDRMDPGLRAFIRENKNAYDLGLQGPDLLFYYQPYHVHPVNRYGRDIHEASAEQFISLAIKALKPMPDEYAEAYLYGFTCHFILDSVFHPEVNTYSETIAGHLKLETELDRLVLEKRGHRPAYLFRRFTLLPPPPDRADALALIYPLTTRGQLEKALRSFRRYSRLIYSPKSGKLYIARLLEKITGAHGLFTGLIMSRKKDRRLYEKAGELYSLFPRAVEEALSSVDSLHAAIRDAVPLSPRFAYQFE